MQHLPRITRRRRFLLSLTVALGSVSSGFAQTVPLTTTSDVARTEFEKGRARLSNADLATAAKHFDAALAADPAFGLAAMYRAAASPVGERAAFMRRASAAKVSEAEGQLIAAYAARLAEDYAGGVTLLEKVAKQFPNDPHVSFYLATEYNVLDRHDDALAALAKTIQADPKFTGAYNLMGYVAMNKGDDAAAERAFRAYIDAAPKDPNPHDSLGEFLMKRGRLDEAAQQFEKALAIDASFTVSRENLVRVAIERANGRFQQAVAKKDADGLAALYTRTARLLPPNEPAVDGRDTIREYWGGFIASGVDGIALNVDEIFIAEDTATEMNTWTVSIGGEVVDSGRAVVVWAKVGDKWLMHRDMWSSDRPVVPAPADK